MLTITEAFAIQTLVPPFLIALAGAPLLLLPWSRRRARVRAAHILRVALYGMIVLSLPALLWWMVVFVVESIAAMSGLAFGVPESALLFDSFRWQDWVVVRNGAACIYPILGRWPGLAVHLGFVLAIVWWWIALVRYLRLEHAHAVAIINGIIATLAILAVLTSAFVLGLPGVRVEWIQLWLMM